MLCYEPEGGAMSIWEHLVFWVILYPSGIALALFLRFSRKVHISGWERFPHNKGGILLTPNHPSLFEPMLMVALFHKGYLRHPLKLGPYSVADKNNFTENAFWKHFKGKLIEVDRSDKSDEETKRRNLESVVRGIGILKDGGNIIIFGEGGRTPGGQEFLYSKTGKHRIRRFARGTALMAVRAKPRVVPVWVSIDWGKCIFRINRMWSLWQMNSIHITIGTPFQVEKGMTDASITERIERELLELADSSN